MMNYVPDPKAQVSRFRKQTEIPQISEFIFPYGASCIACTVASYTQREKNVPENCNTYYSVMISFRQHALRHQGKKTLQMFSGYTNVQRQRHNKTAKPLNGIVLNERRCSSILEESKCNWQPSVRGSVGKSTTCYEARVSRDCEMA